MIRKGLYVLVFVLALFYGVRNWDEISQVPSALRSAHLGWILLALLPMAVNLAAHTLAYRAGYAFANEKRKGRDILPALLSSLAVNVAAPSLNTAGLMYMIDEGKQKGHSGPSTLVGVMLSNIADGTVFLAITLISMQVFRTNNTLIDTVYATTIILAGLLVGICAIMYLGWRYPDLVRRFTRLLPTDKVDWFQREWREFSKQKLQRKSLLALFAWELLANMGKFLVMLILFPAFDVTTGLVVPVVAYVVATLFTIVSITPSGLGIVEGAVTLALVGLGLPVATATSIMLVYRLITFWLPFVSGIVLLQYKAFLSKKHETSPRTPDFA